MRRESTAGGQAGTHEHGDSGHQGGGRARGVGARRAVPTWVCTPIRPRWRAGTTTCASSRATPTARSSRTDMPPELGGSGEALTPGWLMRAGLAVLHRDLHRAGRGGAGIELETLEVRAASHSDTRGILGMKDGDAVPRGRRPRARSSSACASARAACPPSGCGSWSRKRAAAPSCCARWKTACRCCCASRCGVMTDALSQTLRVVQLVGRDLHQRALHGTLVLPVPERRLRRAAAGAGRRESGDLPPGHRRGVLRRTRRRVAAEAHGRRRGGIPAG